VSLCFDVSVVTVDLNVISYIFFMFKMFDIISDYNSTTSSGHIGRMNSMIGSVVLESNNRFFSVMHF
jgi:hypothetical protein